MRLTVFSAALMAIGFGLVLTSSDPIQGAPLPKKRADILPQAAAMATGGWSTAPAAHAVFCADNPQVCVGGGQNRIAMTAKTWTLLNRVNTSYNRAIIAASDYDIHGRSDVWTIGSRFGDCEDFSLSKRRALIAANVPASAMSIAVVRTADGTGHAVLVVRTDRGDFVLDNRRPDIRGWDSTGYRWYKITAPHDPRKWVRVNGARSV